MKKRITCLVVVLCLLLGLTACGGEAGEPLYAERGETERLPIGELAPAKDAGEVLQALSAAGQTQTPDWEDPAADSAGLLLETDPRREGGAVVTDGERIYMLDSYGLIVASAAGKGSEILSYTRIARGGTGWSERIYLGKNRAAVVSTVSGEETEEAWNENARVRVFLMDTTDPRKPEKLAETAVDGALVDAYLYEETLCLVTQRSFVGLPEEKDAESLLPALTEEGETLRLRAGDLYLSPEPGRTALTLVAALRLEDGRIADALAFTGGVEAVCAEGDVLCLARSLWTLEESAPYKEAPYTVTDCSTAARTEIKRLRLGSELTLEGGCLLEGALPDPGALSLEKGVLRAATELDSRSYAAYTDEKHGWTNYELGVRSHSSQITLLDGALNVTAALTRLGGETGISACRFLGSRAWMAASEPEERLYTASLSDPAAPAMTGSFSGAGDRLLLRPFGEDLVLGLAVEGESWKLLMYDVSDPAAPKLADSLSLKDRVPAAALTDPETLFSDAANALIGFPAASGGEYVLIRWTGSGFKEKGAFQLEYVPASTRGLLLDGLLYVCSPSEFYVTDPETMTVLATVSNAKG